MKIGNGLLTLSAVATIVLLAFIDTSCINGDEPKPFDCGTSDLSILFNSKSDLTSCIANDGIISVVAVGGREPFTFSKDGTNFQSSSTFNSLSAGSYSISVKDKNGCIKELAPNIVLSSPNGPAIEQSDIVADTQCASDDGSITINATGGTGTLTYSKDGTTFQASNVFTSLRAGPYTITVKDGVGCTTLVATTVLNQTGVDFDGEILPILQAKCQFSGCHPTNGNWFDYNTAKANAQAIKITTGNGSMPLAPRPGGSLSADQIAMIACWVDHGAPKN